VADLQFIASIVNSLAWPTAAVVAVGSLRKQIAAVIPRMESFEFHGAKATFAALPGFEKMIAAAAKDARLPDEKAIFQQEVSEFSVAEALAPVAPGQAVIDAWGCLNTSSTSLLTGPVRPGTVEVRTLPVMYRWPKTWRRPCGPPSRQANVR
jgi:hypothetical protein